MPGGCCYISGFAIINADLTGSDVAAERALAILRHELAHALGLGHAARPSLLMHHQITAGTTRYGRGDQHGLALLGPRPPSGPVTAPGRLHQDATCTASSRRHCPPPGPRPESSSWATPRRLVWCSAAPT